MENFRLSEDIDATIYAYLKLCDDVKAANKDGRTPSTQKLELFEQRTIELRNNLKKLEKKASAIFEEQDCHGVGVLIRSQGVAALQHGKD